MEYGHKTFVSECRRRCRAERLWTIPRVCLKCWMSSSPCRRSVRKNGRPRKGGRSVAGAAEVEGRVQAAGSMVGAARAIATAEKATVEATVPEIGAGDGKGDRGEGGDSSGVERRPASAEVMSRGAGGHAAREDSQTNDRWSVSIATPRDTFHLTPPPLVTHPSQGQPAPPQAYPPGAMI